MQDLIDSFNYARAIGTREPTESDIQQFMDLAYDWYRKPVLDLPQNIRDEIAAYILEN